MPVGMMSGLGPRNSVLCGGDNPRKKTNYFGGKSVPNSPTDMRNTHMNYELDSSMQGRAHNRGRRLILSVGRVYYRPRTEWDCTPRAKSNIYDCLVSPHGIAMPKGLYFTAVVSSSSSSYFFFRRLISVVTEQILTKLRHV